MVESNRSASPLREADARLEAMERREEFSASWETGDAGMGAGTAARACFTAPLVFRKSRLRSTMVLPRQRITIRGDAVTTATGYASRFSASAAAMNRSAFDRATTTAIRSWDSEMASSVPSRPSYFFRTASRSISRPSASSPTATDTPPAPKSLHRLMSRVTFPSRNSRWIFRSSGALPFWTSLAMVVRDCLLWLLEEPVAPPMPSRPVRPPSRITTSPGWGRSRTTFSAGAAATTTPHSKCLAM